MFKTQRPLRFGDCDPSGIAYFPSYLNILVGVVEEFFEAVGTPWDTMIAERRMGTPTLKLDLTFVRPGIHGDLMDFEIAVKRVGNSSLDLSHRISCKGELLWSAEQRLVATSLDTHTSCPWPDDMRKAFSSHLESP
ncbi:thioesterase family protein [Rhizobium halophytocola]|uniref:4-hydroxybenzoyl-CoA thioesterase n=1 Tax=Rhizobium halophytocola TaxID=735519 RepID=A0ABS4DV99_9HYPH|nr:4-hydroxybenzoyl-CoA thioesterase [Rhizobium halophytocola]